MRQVICFGLALLFVVPLQASNGQDVSNVPCTEVRTIAELSRANSLEVLIETKQDAGSSCRAEIVFATRAFELQPRNRSAAAHLLNLLPQDDEQYGILMTFGDSLCDRESVADITTLSRLGERLSRDFAKAVLLVPEMLPKYVAYAPTSVEDPHSDYAVQMQPVCPAKRVEFVKAVEALPTKEKDWFVKHVFDPEGCHALALPEGE